MQGFVHKTCAKSLIGGLPIVLDDFLAEQVKFRSSLLSLRYPKAFELHFLQSCFII
jgi:hypothetical protein